MKARYLEIEIYEADGWTHHTQSDDLISATGFDLIATAIRQLDGFHFPMIYILLGEFPDSDYLNICGGNGAYFIEIEKDDRFIDFIDVNKGTNEVMLWTSDQGFATEERFVCRDIQTVIAIAQDYALEGEPSRRVTWLMRC